VSDASVAVVAVLSKDVFVEKNALDLKDQYVGGTAPKVQAIFRSALGEGATDRGFRGLT